MDYKTWPRDVSLTKTCVFVSYMCRLIMICYWWISLEIANNPWDYPPITGNQAEIWRILTVVSSAVLLIGIGTMEHRAVTYYWKGKRPSSKLMWLFINMILPICSTRFLLTAKGKHHVPAFWAAYGPEYEEKFLDSDCKLVAKAVNPRYFTKVNSEGPQGFTALSPLGTIRVVFDAPKMVAQMELKLPTELEIDSTYLEYFKPWVQKESNATLLYAEVDLQPLFTAKEVAANIVCVIDKLCLAWPFLISPNPYSFGGDI